MSRKENEAAEKGKGSCRERKRKLSEKKRKLSRKEKEVVKMILEKLHERS